ncbi:PPC domain-containing protein [Bacillus sp. RG28]|uniref:PPC domain-containing protein n=1 Tax=Gottfriedia endophytica TaxID=2820819 RepID=A0A940NM97_9BACI|nr:PPC domain-containing protein [Gottfriedia endophytica]MBP0725151.1 PPC domain-containing protein [Gottfriedia endophytica]
MKFLRKKGQAIAMILIMLFACILNQAIPVKADSVQDLSFNKEVNGAITNDIDQQVYKIVLPQAGKITVNLSSELNDVYLDLYDSNGNKVWDSVNIYTGSKVNPKKWLDSENLEAGTYFVKLSQYYDYTGSFKLQVNYESANNNDIEPNNGMEQAQQITLNAQKLVGYISWNDNVDYYKVVLPTGGRIDVNVSSELHDTNLDLYDANGNKVWDTVDLYTGSTVNPKKWSSSEDLEAGTYYIRMSQYSDYTGKYEIQVNYQAANNNEQEPNNGTEQAQQITLNTQKIVGYISWNDNLDYYKVVLPKAGRIDVNVSSELHDVNLDLYDANGNKVWDTVDLYTGSTVNPKKWSSSEDLEAGTYYIRMSQYSDYTGKYEIQVNYQAANNNEQEPNNGTEQAQQITLNTQKIVGYISWNDNLDYYKVVLPKAGRIDVNVSSELNDVNLDLYDANGNKVWDTVDLYTGSTVNPKKWSSSEDLEAGTYYIRMSQYSNCTGKYEIQVNYQAANNNEQEPNNGTGQAQQINLNTQLVTGYINWNDSLDYYKFNLSKPSKIIINVASELKDLDLDLYDASGNKVLDTVDIYSGTTVNPQRWSREIDLKAGTYYVRLSKYYNNTGKYTLDVQCPSLLAPTLSVDKITTNSQAITGKASSNNKVLAYVGNQKIGEAKVDSQGKFTIKIKKQKKGTKIKVTMVNNQGKNVGEKLVVVS